mmetsp:Transcript_12859/g.30277  ORF Transcript_12859/g.30277 Transcript_12859/m.30277 type:complete len:101 (-) Transcript_12859:191-493(-)
MNRCGAKVAIVQAALDPLAVPEDAVWVNVSARQTLCCSPEWQWLPLNATALAAALGSRKAASKALGGKGGATLRLVLLESFGDAHRIALNGVQVVVAQGP